MLLVGGKKPRQMSFIWREGSFARHQASDYLRVCRGASVSFQFGKSWMSADREVLTIAHSEAHPRQCETLYKPRQDARVYKPRQNERAAADLR